MSTCDEHPLVERAIGSAGADYEQARDIYFEAFPPEERLPLPLLLDLAQREGVDFTAYADPAAPRQVVGLAFTMLVGPYAYLMFLAVGGFAQGRGYGARIIEAVRARSGGRQVVLEIEPLVPDAPNPEQRARRLAFYERNGFHLLGYDKLEEDERYAMLSDGDGFDPEVFAAALRAIVDGAYDFSVVPSA